MLNHKMFHLAIFSGVLLVGFQNCSQNKFSAVSVDPVQKATTLADGRMFEDSAEITIAGSDGGNQSSIDGDDGGMGMPSMGTDGGTKNNSSTSSNNSNSNSSGSDGGSSNSSGSSSSSNGTGSSGSDGGGAGSQGSDGGGYQGNGSDGGGVVSAGADGGAKGTIFGTMRYRCSQAVATDLGYTLKSGLVSPLFTITDPSGKIICNIDAKAAVASLLSKKTFSVPACSAILESNGTIRDGRYNIILHDSSKSKILAGGEQRGILEDSFEGGVKSVNVSQAALIFDTNVLVDDNTGTAVNDARCEVISSPLVVNFKRSPIRLSSPRKGVDYDIMGENSLPVAHTKKRISWVKTSQVMFLAKPNAQGLVLGINELFGDNTVGPDKNNKFATDGFAALAKYDDNKDGYISADDKVFSELRLWADKDLDGASRADELFTLEELEVTVIDLKYDSKYKEKDRYGNKIMYKSVVKMKDNSLLTMFDIWFKHEL